MYVGTYTKKEGHVDGKAKGIYLLNQDPDTGDLNFVCTAAEMINPSFVKVGKMGKYLYAVSELGPNDADSGFVHSFEILGRRISEKYWQIKYRRFCSLPYRS